MTSPRPKKKKSAAAPKPAAVATALPAAPAGGPAPAGEKELWYKDGLSFTCTQCGNCCTGPSGYVWFTDAEGATMAAHLKLTVPQFLRRYAHQVNERWTLNERYDPKGHGYDCVFLQRDNQGKAGCSIYQVRPTQCRTWPFWPEVLRNSLTWAQAGNRCPGINNGNFFPVDQIRIIRDRNQPNP